MTRFQPSDITSTERKPKVKEKRKTWSREEFLFFSVVFLFLLCLRTPIEIGEKEITAKEIEKRFNKNTRLTDGEANMIKDKFKTARNKKGSPRWYCSLETESKDDKIFMGLDIEREAVVSKDCKVKEFIDNKLYYYVKPTGSPAPKFYGQPKIHKPGVPILRIISYSGSPLYNLSKYIANILKTRNSTTFPNYIRNVPIEDDEIMA